MHSSRFVDRQANNSSEYLCYYDNQHAKAHQRYYARYLAGWPAYCPDENLQSEDNGRIENKVPPDNSPAALSDNFSTAARS